MTAPAPAVPARPSSTSTRASSTNTRVLGGLLLVFGSGWMLKQAGIVDLPWSAVVSIVLIALGLAMVVTARSRARTVPLILLGAALSVGLAVSSSDIGIRGGIGERVYRPTELTRRTYQVGVGDLTIDLTRALPEGRETIRGKVGVGHMLVIVPPGMAFRAEIDARFGSAKVQGRQLDVHGRASDSFETPGYATAEDRVLLLLDIGAGEIEVEER
jgi:predicted membrane protein